MRYLNSYAHDERFFICYNKKCYCFVYKDTIIEWIFKQLYFRNQDSYYVFVFLGVVVDKFLLKDVCEFDLKTNRILKMHNEGRGRIILI